MIHDLEVGPAGAAPIARMCNLIIAECLKAGHTRIRVADGVRTAGTEVVAVWYLGDDGWREVMRIPVQAGRPAMAYFREMCDADPAADPGQTGSFRVRGSTYEATVTATFSRGDEGEEIDLQVGPRETR